MFKKPLVVFAAALLLGSASLAVAGEGSTDTNTGADERYSYGRSMPGGKFQNEIWDRVGPNNAVLPFTAAEQSMFERTTRSSH